MLNNKNIYILDDQETIDHYLQIAEEIRTIKERKRIIMQLSKGVGKKSIQKNTGQLIKEGDDSIHS